MSCSSQKYCSDGLVTKEVCRFDTSWVLSEIVLHFLPGRRTSHCIERLPPTSRLPPFQSHNVWHHSRYIDSARKKISLLHALPPSTELQEQAHSFFEQISDFEEYCNPLAGYSFILGNFNFHYDCPLNSDTSRVNSLLSVFNLQQPLNSPTQKLGHVLDWFVHRATDGLLLSIDVLQAASSGYFCVLVHIVVTISSLCI